MKSFIEVFRVALGFDDTFDSVVIVVEVDVAASLVVVVAVVGLVSENSVEVADGWSFEVVAVIVDVVVDVVVASVAAKETQKFKTWRNNARRW